AGGVRPEAGKEQQSRPGASTERLSDLDLVFFDHRVGEQLLAHVLDGGLGLGGIALRQIQIDHLALPHFADRAETQPVQGMTDSLALWIEHAVFQSYKDARFHLTRTGPLFSPCTDSGMMPRRLATSL